MAYNTHGLSNRELLFLYKQNERMLNSFKKTIETKQRIAGAVPFIMIITLSDTEVEELKNDPYFIMVQNIVESLAPVAQLIEEVEPDLLKDLEFNKA